jgi:DNA-binding CsgD family transcriptional regulator
MNEALPEGLADRIYEAAVMPELWPEVLDLLGSRSGSLGGVLFSANAAGLQQWVSSPSLTGIMSSFVGDGWTARNSRLANGLRKGLAFVPRFLTEADLFDEGECDRDPFYTEFLRPRGVGWSAGTLVALPHGDTLTFSIERATEKGPMPAAALGLLDSSRPHLARAAMIAARLSFERARTAVDTLAALGLAACAVSPVGTVLVANSEFDAEQNYWTTRGGGRIALADRRADRQLEAALATIESGSGVRSLPLLAENGGPPAVLHLVPVRRGAHDVFTQASGILVLTKASRAPTHGTSLLQALFDLSATEAQVAARISAGETAEQIAAADGKSVGTVRNQLKSVLAKTGCRRQVDLARLLVQLIPAAA